MSRLDADDLVYASDAPDVPVTCQWFALCENSANGLREHPLLGDVPICVRCDDRVQRIDGAR